MRTIEAQAQVHPDHTLTMPVPVDIPPGEHRVVVLLAEGQSEGSERPAWNFPVVDVGPWPEGLSLRREDMYGDDGR
jgi:hypothetical protein